MFPSIHPIFIRHVGALALCLVATAGSGCGLLSGKGPEARASLGDRPYDPLCRDVDLSSGRLNATSLRLLVHCFNADGKIPELTRLADSVGDENLAPIADLVNRYLFDRPARLFEFDQTLQGLNKIERLSPALSDFGRLLENSELISALIDLGYDGYFSDPSSIIRYVANGFRARPNPKLLAALEVLGQEINADNTAQLIDFGLTYSRSRTWKSFQTHFQSNAPGGALSLEAITGPLIRLSRSGSEPGRVQAVNQTLSLLSRGALWKTIDARVPDRIETSSPNLAGWAELLGEIGQSPSGAGGTDDTFLANSSTFFRKLDDKKDVRIPCLQGTQKLVSITPSLIFDEMRRGDQRLRDLLVTLYATQPFCDFKGIHPDLLPSAQTLVPSVLSDSSEELEAWLKALSEDTLDASTSENVRFAVSLLAEHGSLVGEGTGRLRLVAPLLQELQSRDAIKDLLLLATLPRIQDRARLNSALEIVTRSRSELEGNSVVTVVTDLVAKTKQGSLDRLIRSLLPFVDGDRELAAPALASLREIFWSNDSHPGVELVREVLVDAKRNEPFFTALFDIVASERSQFEKAVHELSVAARADDGRLKSVLLSLAALLREHGERGRYEITTSPEPKFIARARHNLVGSELKRTAPARATLPTAYDNCRKLDFAFSIDRYEAENFLPQFQSFVECLVQTDGDSYLRKPLEFLNSTGRFMPESGLARENKSLFTWMIDQLRFIAGGETQADEELSRRAIEALRDGRMSTLLKAMPHWVSLPAGTPRSEDPRDNGSLMSPLLNLLEKISHQADLPSQEPTAEEKRKKLRERVVSMPAQVCVYEKSSEKDDTLHMPRCTRYEKSGDAILAQLNVWEPQAKADRRTAEIIDEFIDSIEHDFQSFEQETAQASRLQTRWSRDLFLKTFSKTYNQLVNPFSVSGEETPEARNQHRTLEGALEYLKSLNPAMSGFVSPDKAFSAEELDATANQVTDFLFKQAETLNVIAYYYRGSKEPRVRIVSDLDRLGLLMSNTEIFLTDGTEPGLLGLGITSMAWEGEAEEHQPRYIVDDPGAAYGLPKMVDYFLMGLPAETGCIPKGQPLNFDLLKPRQRDCITQTRNLRGAPLPRTPLVSQAGLTAIFQDYLLDQPEGQEDCLGKTTDCLGLRLVRNLGSALWDRIPEELRPVGDRSQAPDGSPHNFKILTLIGKLGLLRKTSIALLEQTTPGDRETVRDFVRAGILLSRHPDYPKLIAAAKALLDPSEKGDWSQSSRIFGTTGLMRSLSETLFEARENEFDSLKRISFFGMAVAPALELTDKDLGALGWLGDVLSSAVRPQDKGGSREILTEHVSALKTALGSSYFAQTAASLYDDSRDPKGDWKVFQTRLERVREEPAYRSLDVKRVVIDPVLDFIASPPGAPSPGRDLYNQLLLLLAHETDEKNLEAVARLAGNQRGEIEDLLRMLGRIESDGSAEKLISLTKRWLPPQK